MTGLTRRSFLGAAATGLVAAACSSDGDATPTTAGAGPSAPSTGPSTTTGTTAGTTTTAATTTAAAPAPVVGLATDPFTCGVASGDPLPGAVVLWTRADPGGAATSVPLAWEVAADEGFATVVVGGTVTVTADDDFTAHVDVTGLAPDTRYHFRFRVDAYEARGRTRTAPAPDQAVDQLRFGFGSCQDFQNGFYAAHRDVAASDLDVFVWLGDYIYEYGPRPGAVRAHTGGECTTLADYRARYALYRGDADLQAAHASCPWLVVWDDHEVENNYAAGRSEDDAVTAEAFATRRAAGYRAWWEYMPTRLARPEGDSFRIHRDLAWGTLARFYLLDGRQYRSDQACGDAILNTQPPCAEWGDTSRTMLGAEQEQWLLDGLRGQDAAWNVLGNQVVMGDARLNGAVLNYDQWDGYPVARERLLRGIADTGRRNVVVVTGDIHLSAVADVRLDDGLTTVATEFVGTSISSGALLPASLEGAIGLFPALKHLNARQRGWVRATVDATTWTTEFRVVADPTVAATAVTTDATFVVANGTPGAVRR